MSQLYGPLSFFQNERYGEETSYYREPWEIEAFGEGLCLPQYFYEEYPEFKPKINKKEVDHLGKLQYTIRNQEQLDMFWILKDNVKIWQETDFGNACEHQMVLSEQSPDSTFEVREVDDFVWLNHPGCNG